MFTKSDKNLDNKIELSGSELSKLTVEELTKLLALIPTSITTIDLSKVKKTDVQDIKETLDNAGITIEGKETPQISQGTQRSKL